MSKTIVIMLFVALVSLAGSIQFNWNATASDVQINKYAEWDVLSVEGGIPAFANGYPNLPAVSRCYVIPQGTTVTDVEVRHISTVSLGHGFLPDPVMVMLLDGDAPELSDYTDASFEDLGYSFPASFIVGFKTGTKTGFRLGSYSFVPFVYHENSGELLLITSADISLIYESDPDAPVYSLSEGQVELAKRGLATFIDNPEMLDSRAPSQRPETDDDVEVLIVGYNQHSEQLEDLVSFHNTLGYNAESVTIQWIVANVEGYDAPEKIRNHIKSFYENQGLLFAVIAGDNGSSNRLSMLCAPHRVPPMNTTADLYFSDLDGNWDADGDNKYGECNDEVDYYSDIYVGRYPVKLTEDEVLDVMIDNVTEYHFSPVSGEWQKRALLIGGWFNYEEPEAEWAFGSKYCDTVSTFFPVDWSFDSLCEDSTGYHPDNQMEYFNQGTAFVAVFSVGNVFDCFWDYTYSPIFSVSTIPEMNNQNNLPWMILPICTYSGYLGVESFSEAVVGHEGGGALLVTVPSSSAFTGSSEPGPNGWIGIYFSHLLFEEELVTSGVTHGISKDMLWANWNSFYIPRKAEWALQSINLYGDPCAVFIDAPEGVEQGESSLLSIRVIPNPVFQNMSVQLLLPEASTVAVRVYDMTGRCVLPVEENVFAAGEHSLGFDVSGLSAGMYVIRANACGVSCSNKCIILE